MIEQKLVTLQAEPQPLEIDLRRLAIVVVDMQNAFASKGGMVDLWGFDLSRVPLVIKNIKKIIEAARNQKIKVIYIAHTVYPDLRELGPASPFGYNKMVLESMHKNPRTRDKVLLRGTWGADIIDELKPRKDEILVEKRRYSAFAGTDLDMTLKTFDIKYLAFMGLTANICVEPGRDHPPGPSGRRRHVLGHRCRRRPLGRRALRLLPAPGEDPDGRPASTAISVTLECTLDTIVILPLALWQVFAVGTTISGHDLIAAAILGLVCTAVAYTMWVDDEDPCSAQLDPRFHPGRGSPVRVGAARSEHHAGDGARRRAHRRRWSTGGPAGEGRGGAGAAVSETAARTQASGTPAAPRRDLLGYLIVLVSYLGMAGSAPLVAWADAPEAIILCLRMAFAALALGVVFLRRPMLADWRRPGAAWRLLLMAAMSSLTPSSCSSTPCGTPASPSPCSCCS